MPDSARTDGSDSASAARISATGSTATTSAAGRDQRARQLPGPGRQVEDDPARSEPEALGQQRDRLLRIAGPPELVGSGRPLVADCRRPVDAGLHAPQTRLAAWSTRSFGRDEPRHSCSTPAGRGPHREVVGRLLAVQAQELRSARLAVRARASGLTATAVDRELTEERSLVVGWLLRGTLHMVRREDYAWLHALTAPRQTAGSRRRLGEEGVSPAEAERAVELVETSLAAEGPLTRAALAERLAAAGIPTEGQATPHLLRLAALEGVAVLGPVRDGVQAYALAREWLGEAAHRRRPRSCARDPGRALSGRACACHG